MPRKGLDEDKILHTFEIRASSSSAFEIFDVSRDWVRHWLKIFVALWRALWRPKVPLRIYSEHYFLLYIIENIPTNNFAQYFSCHIQNICNIFCTIFFSSLSPAELSPNHRPISKWSGPSGLLRNISMLTTHCTLAELGKYSLNIFYTYQTLR